MNLFILDKDPVQAAKWSVNSHVTKIIVEGGQLISTAFNLQGVTGFYKTTHRNHPTSIWTRASKANFDWTVEYSLALCEEYTARYGKVHKTQQHLEWARDNARLLKFDKTELTPFAQAMPDEYKDPCAVTAYRNYYKFGKKHLHSWKRNKPDWIA